MPRQQESVDAVVGIAEQGGKRRRHELVAGENGEVVQLALFGGEDGRRDRRGGGLEADAEEDDHGVGIVGGEGQGVERGVYDGYAGSVGLRVLEGAPVRAGNAHQVAEGGDDDVRLFGELEEGGDFAVVGHADRAARPREVGDLLGKERAQAASEDGYGMGSADFHKPHGAVEEVFEAAEQGLAKFGIMQRWRGHGFLRGKAVGAGRGIRGRRCGHHDRRPACCSLFPVFDKGLISA